MSVLIAPGCLGTEVHITTINYFYTEMNFVATSRCNTLAHKYNKLNRSCISRIDIVSHFAKNVFF